MRTLLLVGIAGFAAWYADSALANQYERVERRVTVINSAIPQDDVVYVSNEDSVPTEADYRGRWQGEWNGRWIDGDPRAYEGTYEGTYDNRGVSYDRGTSYEAPAPTRVRERSSNRSRTAARRDREARRYSDADMARMCRRDNGLGGAAIGGVVGGVVGNRVAGRGNRTAGTLIGAGAGALAGTIIDQNEDRRACEAWLRSQPVNYRSAPVRYRSAPAAYPPAYPVGYGYPVTYGYPVASYPVTYRSTPVRYRTTAADGITRGWVLPGSDRVFTSEELADLCVTGARNEATESGLCDSWAAETGGNAVAPAPVASDYAESGYAAAGTTYADAGAAYVQPVGVTYSAPIIIEETETYYETVSVPASRPAARRATPVRPTARRAAAPRRAARCTCR